MAPLARFVLREQCGALSTCLEQEYSGYRQDHSGEVSPFLIRLLISGEDHRYFRHAGVDLIALCRAVWRRVAWGKVEGASTIEMQMTRVLTGNYERTWKRKIKEILLATQVNETIPKADLPAVYLRRAYFGWRMNGLKQACDRLGLRANSMTLPDAASVIARLKYPQPRFLSRARWSKIKRRQRHIMRLYTRHSERGLYRVPDRRTRYATVQDF
jgi:penicillin-binding protein 1A